MASQSLKQQKLWLLYHLSIILLQPGYCHQTTSVVLAVMAAGVVVEVDDVYTAVLITSSAATV